MLLPAPPPALRKPPLLLPAVLTTPEAAPELPLPPPAGPLPTPTVPAPAAPPPPEPYRWPDLSVGDPNAPDPLRGLGWPELRALIYEPDGILPGTPPPASLPETP